MADKITYFTFESNIKSFLKGLLNNPIEATPTETLIEYGLNRNKLLKILLNKGIIEKTNEIKDIENTSPQFSMKFSIPKKNFERKLKKLYILLFEKNLPSKTIETSNVLSEDEGGCDGGMGAAVANDSAPIGPIGGVVKRKFHLTREQIHEMVCGSKIDETVTSATVGNFGYDAPFSFKDENGKKDEAYVHNKKGGIGSERLK